MKLDTTECCADLRIGNKGIEVNLFYKSELKQQNEASIPNKCPRTSQFQEKSIVIYFAVVFNGFNTIHD